MTDELPGRADLPQRLAVSTPSASVAVLGRERKGRNELF